MAPSVIIFEMKVQIRIWNMLMLCIIYFIFKRFIFFRYTLLCIKRWEQVVIWQVSCNIWHILQYRFDIVHLWHSKPYLQIKFVIFGYICNIWLNRSLKFITSAWSHTANNRNNNNKNKYNINNHDNNKDVCCFPFFSQTFGIL